MKNSGFYEKDTWYFYYGLLCSSENLKGQVPFTNYVIPMYFDTM